MCYHGRVRSTLDGCTSSPHYYDDTTFSASASASEPPPHWQRLAYPQHHRRTRVTTVAQCPPSPKPPGRRADAHSALDAVRPADVVVYVVPDDGDVAAVDAMLEHVQVQGRETLHVVVLYGQLST